jgi:hypothetical protein
MLGLPQKTAQEDGSEVFPSRVGINVDPGSSAFLVKPVRSLPQPRTTPPFRADAQYLGIKDWAPPPRICSPFRIPGAVGISFAIAVALSLEIGIQWMKDFGATAQCAAGLRRHPFLITPDFRNARFCSYDN